LPRLWFPTSLGPRSKGGLGLQLMRPGPRWLSSPATSTLFVLMLLAVGCSGDIGDTTGASPTTSTPSIAQETLRDSPLRLTVHVAGEGEGSVRSSPLGINCPPDCEWWYKHNQEITLSYTSAANSAFGEWGGVCSGQENPCIVDMDSDYQDVTATFNAITAGPTAPEGETGPPPITNSGIFRIVISGIWCHTQTYDDILQLDGKGDEVFLSVGESIVGSNGTPIIQGHTTTSVVIGDEHYKEPDRQIAGQEVGLLGFDTEDKFPYPEPWELTSAPTRDRIPFLVARVNLSGGEAITITPTIWEYDGHGDGVRDWVKWVSQTFDSAMPSLNKVISNPSPSTATSAGGVITPSFVLTAISLGLRALANLPTGTPGDRPIGVSEGGSFVPTVIVLTADNARWLIQNDLGKGYGVIEIPYQDKAGQPGNYSLFIHVREL